MGIARVAVIGGGPAGVIAAGYSAKGGNHTVLLEKNNILLKKLLITGKGRCNITNNCDISDFFTQIPKNPEFMYSALYSFTNGDIVSLLADYGVETKVERGNRIFPVSGKAKTVADALEKFARGSGVQIKLNSEVKGVTKKDGKFIVSLKNGGKFEDVKNIDKLIIATGGISYPLTGSTGDGYKFAEKFGHSVTETKGGLVPLETKEEFVRELVGLSLKNVGVKIKNSRGKTVYDDFGEMLFSHYGVTGPTIISASSHINEKEENTIIIDLKPALSEKQLDERIIRDFLEFKNKNFANSLVQLLPKSLIPVIVKLSAISPDKKVNEITKEERRRLVSILKNFTLTFKKKRPVRDAIITSGGINVNEINPSTMESKIMSGLYFCGEILDVDGYTGGFNLQIAYSTGYLAGTN
jgi:predicted Rossmann fold flavoprotein